MWLLCKIKTTEQMYASVIPLSIQQLITEYLAYAYALSYKEK